MTQSVPDLGVVVLGAGHVALVADEALSEAAIFRRSQAGDTILAASAAARLGVDVALVTRVGEDPFTPWLLEGWEVAGMHLDYVVRGGGRNVLSLVGPGQPLVWTEDAAVAQLEPNDVRHVPWHVTKVVYTSGTVQSLGDEPSRTITTAFETARGHGATTVFNPMLRSSRWSGRAHGAAHTEALSLLELVDVLVVDAPYATGKLFGQPTPEAAAHEALRRGVGRCVVHQGGRGCLVVEDGEFVTLGAPRSAEVRGDAATMGAFHGGILAALARGSSLADATRLGLAAQGVAGTDDWGLVDLPSGLAVGEVPIS